GGTLFLRLGRELQRIAFAAAGLSAARRLGLGDIARENAHHADTAAMRRHHHPVGLVLAHAEFALEHGDDEFARRVVVVEQNHFVQARPFRLETNLGARLDSDIRHCGSSSWSRGRYFRMFATMRAIRRRIEWRTNDRDAAKESQLKPRIRPRCSCRYSPS